MTKKKISVVVPVFNEHELIDNTIHTLIKEADSWDYDYEIIFVNDGSTDSTYSILKDAANSNPKLNDNTYSIEFEWHDVEELRKILDETIRLVLINIKKTVIIEINILADSIKRSNEKSMIDLQSKLNTINEFKDQYLISKDSLTEFQQYQIFLSHYDVMVQNLLSINEINSDNIKIIENDNETDWIKTYLSIHNVKT